MISVETNQVKSSQTAPSPLSPRISHPVLCWSAAENDCIVSPTIICFISRLNCCYYRPVIWGGGVERVLTPPPPVTKNLKIYPSNILQNPPYCTNLQLKKTPPDPPIRSSPNINSSSILQGGPINLF